MDKKYCLGCRNDFYNYDNHSTTGECWQLKNAKLKTRYAVGWWTPTLKKNFRKVKKPSCYHKPGDTYYTDDISQFSD